LVTKAQVDVNDRLIAHPYPQNIEKKPRITQEAILSTGISDVVRQERFFMHPKQESS
jgi:hypothetical protein